SHGVGLVQILLICVPSTLLAVLIAAFVQLRVGKEVKDDPEYQRLVTSGEIEPPGKSKGTVLPPLKKGAKASAVIFLTGVALVVLAGIFPTMRTVASPSERLARVATALSAVAGETYDPRLPADSAPEKKKPLGMPIAIAIVMLAVAALILAVTKAPVNEVPRCKTC